MPRRLRIGRTGGFIRQARPRLRTGDVRACVNLGADYANGTGVAKDAKRARDLFVKACNAKDMLGCADLGGLYSTGAAVPPR